MRRKEITWDVRRTRRFTNRADQQICDFGKVLEEQYGFLADPDQPVWYNVERRIAEMSMEELESRPSNMACHNLLKYNPLPQGTNQLLGCGLNHCNQSSTATDTIKYTFDRFNEVIRKRWAFLETPPEEREHIKKLYIASEYKFSRASPEIMESLLNFQNAVQSEQL